MRYLLDGLQRTATIAVGSDRTYTAGQQVTVIADPADPDRVRTPEEANSGELGKISLLVLVVAAGGVVLSALATVRWHRRHRAAGETGWQPLPIEVHRASRMITTVTVRYPGGKAQLHEVTPPWCRDAPAKFDQAWVGGDGSAVVFLFACLGRRRLLAVPARRWPAGGWGLGRRAKGARLG